MFLSGTVRKTNKPSRKKLRPPHVSRSIQVIQLDPIKKTFEKRSVKKIQKIIEVSARGVEATCENEIKFVKD